METILFYMRWMPMFDWVRENDVLLGWLGSMSLLMFFGTLVAVPWLVVRIPADFFIRRQHYVDRWRPRHPLLWMFVLILKNGLGLVLVAVGIVMLVVPGQGILTILVGLLFLDLPGKFALERRLIRLRPVIKSVNWMRRKARRAPLELPPERRKRP